MEIRIGSLLAGAREATGTTIIVDVFRAFTTAAVAFTRGAEKIILVAEVDEALELRGRGLGDLCMGEVAGIRPEEFDFGNSPFELSSADVKGKTLIQSTRAGTVGVTLAGGADRMYAGSLIIAQATVAAVLRHRPETVSIVAMGSEGKERSDEDEHCALYMRNLLQGRQSDHDALQSLILTGAESQKYGDPDRPHFHPKDMEIALQIDSIPFAVSIVRENGLLVARPEIV